VGKIPQRGRALWRIAGSLRLQRATLPFKNPNGWVTSHEKIPAEIQSFGKVFTFRVEDRRVMPGYGKEREVGTGGVDGKEVVIIVSVEAYLNSSS